MPDELPPISPDLQAELTALAETLAERPDHADVAARLEWLIDTLILREQLPESFRRLVAKVNGRERSVVRLAMFRDKYAVPSADIDCAERIPLCGARCCSFEVSLTSEQPEVRAFKPRRWTDERFVRDAPEAKAS